MLKSPLTSVLNLNYFQDLDDDQREQRIKKKKGKRKTIFEMYEPAELEMRHFTEQDNEIRNMDIPERMQLRNFPVRFVLPFDKVHIF